MNGRRLFQTVVLVVGFTGLALTVASTLDDASEQVMPGPGALAAAAALALAAILTSGRAWVALFHDTLHDRGHRMRFEGNYYVSQLTKYVPAGGAVQAASQVSMASAAGVPLGRVALAFPVSAVGSIAAGATIGSGLAFVPDLPAWARALSLLGLATPAVLHRRFLAGVLEFGRRFVRRIPATDRLPSQRRILTFYAWAVVSMGCTAGAYTVLLQSLSDEASPGAVFVAYAMSWTVGFLAVPLPAGIGVREAVLVACLPGVGAAPLIAASLAHRLLGIGAELTAAFGTKIVARARSVPDRPEARATEVATQDEGGVSPLSRLHQTD